MNCPVDWRLLSLADQQDVKIDHRPRRRRIRLDQGDFDKPSDHLVTIDRRSERAHARTQRVQLEDGGYFTQQRRQGVLGEPLDFD